MRDARGFLVVTLKLSVVACAFVLSGCREKKDEKPLREYEKQSLSQAANDVSLPSKLWDLVAQGAGNEQTEFVPVKVMLIEKTRGTLGGHHHEITFGQGGGEIDLKDYVTGPGSFYLTAELVQRVAEAPLKQQPEKESEKKAEGGEKKEPEKKEPEKKDEKKEAGPVKSSAPELKIFFLSQAKERKVAGVTYGAGCHAYFDITSHFIKASQKEGLLGIVAGQRYVSTLSGVYFISKHENDRLQLAQVTVRDSRYPDLGCRHE
jgi:hypothetical protein